MAGLEGIVDAYLSQRHRAHPNASCAIAILGPEVTWQGNLVRATFFVQMENLIAALAAFMPDASPAERRNRSLTVMTQLVETIVLARAYCPSRLSAGILHIMCSCRLAKLHCCLIHSNRHFQASYERDHFP